MSETAEQFGDKVLGILNGGSTAVLMSLGHRAGLFDAMADPSGLACRPATSSEIAQAAGNLNERYVREWLAGMAVSGIVDLAFESSSSQRDNRYVLPAHRAPLLTRAGGADNMALFAQYIPLGGSVEDRILRCFREGGGLPYDEYPTFQQVMSEDSGQSVLSCLFSALLPVVDAGVAPDQRPGGASIMQRLESGIRVADLGCGSGRALCAMAQRFPASTFVGLDISDEGLAACRQYAQQHALANASAVKHDAAQPPPEQLAASFDLVTAFDCIHDQAQPRSALQTVRALLKPDGIFLMQDIDMSAHVSQNVARPLSPLIYMISTVHCMSVSLAYQGEGLGAAWGVETAQRYLADAGFTRITLNRLAHDPQNAYFVSRPN